MLRESKNENISLSEKVTLYQNFKTERDQYLVERDELMKEIEKLTVDQNDFRIQIEG